MDDSELATIAAVRAEFAAGGVEALREDNKYPRRELADVVGVSAPTWKRWEDGESSPRARHALAAAPLLERLHADDNDRRDLIRREVLERLDAMVAVVADSYPGAAGDAEATRENIARLDAEGLQAVLDILTAGKP